MRVLRSKGSHDGGANAPRPIADGSQEREPRRDSPKSDPRALGGNALVQLATIIEQLQRIRCLACSRAEYAGYVRANKFVAILKRQARQIANSQS